MANSKKVSTFWCGKVMIGGPWGTVPELLFEKKGLIPKLQQQLVSHLWLQTGD